MPESLLDRRLKLGRFLGIGLYVHWTFLLVIAYVAVVSRQGGLTGILFAWAQLAGIFFCVTLHEYGHAMAARQFGIGTADITLLPIGGVARLQRMPRIPWQELVVAVAGPAVNVVIAFGLLVSLILFTDGQWIEAYQTALAASITGAEIDEEIVEFIESIFVSPSWIGYGVLMLFVNIMLVVFNMIPAFPMDGGRVFRSLLAMVFNYVRATRIASRVGVGCALLMAFFALSASPPAIIPALIAAFIGYAGIAEARHVEVMETVRGLTAGRSMVRTTLTIPAEMPLAELAEHWSSITAPALPVTAINDRVIGILPLRVFVQRLAKGSYANETVADLLSEIDGVSVVREDELLEEALPKLGKRFRQVPVVDRNGVPIGILDLDTMLARSELAKHRRSSVFDQVS